jgi:predicted DNA-binding transcriptional regulator AlpA
MKSSAILNIGPQMVPGNETLLSVKQVAAHLGVSKSWLYQSDIPSVKLGRRRLYRPSDLAGYVSAHVSHHLHREAE